MYVVKQKLLKCLLKLESVKSGCVSFGLLFIWSLWF